jgi:hypothetical protein
VVDAEVDGEVDQSFRSCKARVHEQNILNGFDVMRVLLTDLRRPGRDSGKEIKQVAPPPLYPRWTGFYVGGYKFGSTDVDLSLGGDWNFRPEDRNVVEAHAPDNLDGSGAEAGGLIGYNYQFRNNWVVGLEAADGYLWLRNSDESGIFHTPATGTSISRPLSKHIIGYDWATDWLYLWQVASICDWWTRHW